MPVVSMVRPESSDAMERLDPSSGKAPQLLTAKSMEKTLLEWAEGRRQGDGGAWEGRRGILQLRRLPAIDIQDKISANGIGNGS